MVLPRHSETGTEGNETGRIEAFSDGVFAIAITLLVLDLRLPGDDAELDDDRLFTALTSLGPTYLAFFITFAFIGIMWINHHRLFTHIARSDTWLQVLNLGLLLGVTILPFPTAVLADHLGNPGEQTAALVYNGLFVLIAIVFNVLWRYASGGNRLLAPTADPVAVGRITRQYLFGPLLYLAAFLLALINVPLSLLLNLLLAVFFALPGPAPRPPA
jgi:uncharacterized membrane protein